MKKYPFLVELEADLIRYPKLVKFEIALKRKICS
jgi:hypothetical protein